jgi:phosphatidylglycerophosphatase A
MKKLISYIPTLGPIGYLPASGTAATLATIPLVLLAQAYLTYPLYVALCIAIFLFGILSIKKTVRYFDVNNDPACIVIDEVTGCMVTFACMPLNVPVLVLGFLLFRLFDIYKLGFIKKCENLPGAWGIMVDDFAAGVLANIVLQLLAAFLI